MLRSSVTGVLLLTYCIISTLANVCPDQADFTPCTCEEETKRIQCRSTPDFDIKALFDRVTPLINGSAVFEELYISSTDLTSIPAYTFTSLKFKIINLEFNLKLAEVSPLAFNDTFPITQELKFYIPQNSATPTELFLLLNKFENAETIRLTGSKLTSIPANAIQNPNLLELGLATNWIEEIGDFAFAGLTNLEILDLSRNSINSSSLLMTANSFSGINGKAVVDLSNNYNFKYMDEDVFKPMLDNVVSVQVGGGGCGPVGCSYLELECDERAHWICQGADVYKPKLTGYRCVGRPWSTDIFDYCGNLGV